MLPKGENKAKTKSVWLDLGNEVKVVLTLCNLSTQCRQPLLVTVQLEIQDNANILAME